MDRADRKWHPPPPGHGSSWSRAWSTHSCTSTAARRAMSDVNGQTHRSGGSQTLRGQGSTLCFDISPGLGSHHRPPRPASIPSPT